GEAPVPLFRLRAGTRVIDVHARGSREAPIVVGYRVAAANRDHGRRTVHRERGAHARGVGDRAGPGGLKAELAGVAYPNSAARSNRHAHTLVVDRNPGGIGDAGIGVSLAGATAHGVDRRGAARRSGLANSRDRRIASTPRRTTAELSGRA